jgi:hypothetical protein
MYLMSLATKFPLANPSPTMPTPEDNWCDPTVQAICCYTK